MQYNKENYSKAKQINMPARAKVTGETTITRMIEDDQGDWDGWYYQDDQDDQDGWYYQDDQGDQDDWDGWYYYSVGLLG